MNISSLAPIEVSLPVEICHALKKGVAHQGPVWHTSFMPSQGSPDKTYLTIRVPRALKRRLEKLAESRGETLTDLVIAWAQKAVSNIELTAKDYEQIAKEVAAAEATIKKKRKSNKSSK